MSPQEVDPDTRDEVVTWFSFHPATGSKAQRHENVRSMHRSMAIWILASIPDCRERSLALTKLQESMMWCNAAVAYRLGDPGEGSQT